VSDEEFKRICEAFKRLSGGNQLLTKQSFIVHVLGDGVPQAIAEWLYIACGGTPRGIALKDLICGLVLLTKGKQDEKIRFLFTLYCNDSGTHITRNEFHNALQIEGPYRPTSPTGPVSSPSGPCCCSSQTARNASPTSISAPGYSTTRTPPYCPSGE
jgi:hypothetical protein